MRSILPSLLIPLLACDGFNPPIVDPADTAEAVPDIAAETSPIADLHETSDDDSASRDSEPSETSPPDTAPGDTLDGDAADTHADLDACTLASRPLALVGLLPYAEVRIGPDTGWFLVDWGTTGSAIDPRAFSPATPQPAAGTYNQWNGFDFFGPWATVTLGVQDLSHFTGPPPQAGILGTDFLSLDAYLVDWTTRIIARVDCTDLQLEAAGLTPFSVAGSFSDTPATLPAGVPNVPAVPLKLGTATAFPAQVDTGYGDALYGPAININRALFDRIPPGVLTRAPSADLALSTCVPGVTESVPAYRVAAPHAAELVDRRGTAHPISGAWVFLKDTPSAARSCGGIGTWSSPAAQLGVSVVARQAVFDPGRAAVWLRY